MMCGRSSNGRASDNQSEDAGSNPADRFPAEWSVSGIEKWEAKPWILNRHYAERMPSIQRAYGLFDASGTIRGVCTFGPPPRMLNDGYGLFGGELKVRTYELNRLVAGDIHENGLSWFVSRCLDVLPHPSAVIAYADANWGHTGYIYQATNWVYLGTTDDRRPTGYFLDTETGDQIHERTIVDRYGSRSEEALPDHIQLTDEVAKHRYLYLCGSSGQKRWMRRHLVYDEKPYPKGDNGRYDDSGTVAAQGRLFA